MALIAGLAWAGPAAAFAQSRPAPVRLLAGSATNPLGIDHPHPRLSWQLAFDERGAMQTAYQVQAAGSADELRRGAGITWDTGRVKSDQSLNLPYNGPELHSGDRCYWRVRAWDEQGRASAWSEPAFLEMGLLQPADWQAQWITPDWDEDLTKSQPSPLLRKAFAIDRPVRSARLYATSLGLYEMQLNGQRVGDEQLTPGWTAYEKRLEYQTYDVTALLRPGANAVGATLGDGWFRGTIGRTAHDLYGTRLALLAVLRITFADGSTQVVGTDGTWQASTGPIRASEIYNGETYDARLEKAGWSEPDYDAHAWAGVRRLDHPKDTLTASEGPPVRRIQEIKPIAILHTPAGETVFDLGQNLVGWVRLKVRGPAGATVTLRHAEVLDQSGNFYTTNLRGAQQTISYTLKGDGEETYEPHFTYQGFRYVAIQGYPGEPTLDSVTGVVLHADMPQTGHWESSRPLLNQLQHNIVWSQKGNFVAVPSDCPQRDERMGWTGDAQMFARTASFNFDVDGFLTRWLRDLAAEQKVDGSVPSVIPDGVSHSQPTTASAAGWGDAAVIIPWTLYLAYGDLHVLQAQYASMKRWVDWVHARNPDLVWSLGPQYGDWLAYTSPPEEARSYPGATTGKDLVATAFFAHSAELLAQTATVLGQDGDARAYHALGQQIKAAFNQEFVTPAGRVGENTQTAYTLALRFNLLPDGLRDQAVRRLAADIALHHNHLTTGFLGTPYLCSVLSEHGQLDTAYALLEQEDYPGWLYPVTRGATTIWERWDGIKADGSFEDAQMNSFNHYGYGAVGDWMYRVVAGIDVDPAAPGYKHVLIQPQPGGGLTFVRARLQTPYGEVASAWEVAGDHLQVTVQVPPNTRATVRLPGATLGSVTEAGQPLAGTTGIGRSRQDGTVAVIELGAGTYAFSYPSAALAAKLSGGAAAGPVTSAAP